MLDIFVDFQIILRKKNLPQLDNVGCPTAISITEHNLLAYWCFSFLEILDNPTLYCPTGKSKPRNSEEITQASA